MPTDPFLRWASGFLVFALGLLVLAAAYRTVVSPSPHRRASDFGSIACERANGVITHCWREP